ncbi:MAG: type II toxin-antitoxin system Phd/YefM family antitoxin [Deltaproteobacteria bacterium]|jgi:prevent-host-death family protein|nr:type II toxin-antitoxin system Phd/YefM family antitoxin [Deltaproteobacteria bacterium]
MQTVNTHEAKTHLSHLLKKVANGEEVIIAKSGKPIAKLVPIKQSTVRRVPGIDKKQGWIVDDFDAALPDDIQSYFE